MRKTLTIDARIGVLQGAVDFFYPSLDDGLAARWCAPVKSTGFQCDIEFGTAGGLASGCKGVDLCVGLVAPSPTMRPSRTTTAPTVGLGVARSRAR